jgi:hypothetical protein
VILKEQMRQNYLRRGEKALALIMESVIPAEAGNQRL